MICFWSLLRCVCVFADCSAVLHVFLFFFSADVLFVFSCVDKTKCINNHSRTHLNPLGSFFLGKGDFFCISRGVGSTLRRLSKGPSNEHILNFWFKRSQESRRIAHRTRVSLEYGHCWVCWVSLGRNNGLMLTQYTQHTYCFATYISRYTGHADTYDIFLSYHRNSALSPFSPTAFLVNKTSHNINHRTENASS